MENFDTDRGRSLEVLYHISKILKERMDQNEMLSEILAALEQDLGMGRGTIMLLSLSGKELVVETGRDIDSRKMGAVGYQKGEGVTGQVLQTGKAEVIPRISEEPRFQGRVHHRPSDQVQDYSFICVPISLENEVVGTLSVDLPFEGMDHLAQNERILSIVSSMIATNVNSRRIAKIERQSLEAENLRLRNALGETFRPDNIIGNARLMQEVYVKIHQVAESATTVLVRGESGTGKELVASAIHYGSGRSERPFIKVNCAQLSENLLESELFGHEKGAFTGASQVRIGRLEEANGGTIFFDEIGDFSPAIQVKLLRVLQEREIQRVGSNRTIHVDARVVAATNQDLERRVREGVFRQDLYYRINVFPIYLPPLRERREDIPRLADFFVKRFAAKMGKDIHRISTTAINMMLAYHWPGNVRELENCIEYAILISKSGVIHGQDLPPTLQMPDDQDAIQDAGTLKARVNILEQDMIVDALKRSRGNVSAAARELGITARMVRYKLKKYGIDPNRFSGKNS
ncbi:MAG: sigma 54-interacting transcriptional regulator [Candidatus Sumerlaeia bacterium]